ncbi:hypothetical protein ACPW7J_08340 [Ihubacter sp. rT4E-8]|uniref:hypothetical protein n=1 Tax=Ihubacter sp. rT4E-8 TaxID=3242369 RepID=UPI003CECC390
MKKATIKSIIILVAIAIIIIAFELVGDNLVTLSPIVKGGAFVLYAIIVGIIVAFVDRLKGMK